MSGTESRGIQKDGSRTSRILPICALLISAVACAASLYQLRMASSSMSAQTWPYVTIGWRHANDEIGIVINNDGLGPALIRDVLLTVDQKNQHDAVSALEQIIRKPTIKTDGAEVRIDVLVRGSVIRAGNAANIFLVRGAAWANRMRAAQSRINLEICYCSILGQCWINSLTSVVPREVVECAEDDSRGLKAPETLTNGPD